MSAHLIQPLDKALVGCDKLTYLHLGFPSFKRPAICLFQNLRLPALKDLSFTSYNSFARPEEFLLDDVRDFNSFCTAHKLSRLRFRCHVAWRAFSTNLYGSLVDIFNTISRVHSTSRNWTEAPATVLQSKPDYLPLDALFDFERFYADHELTSQPIAYEEGRAEDMACPGQDKYPIKETTAANAETLELHELPARKFRYVARELRLAVGGDYEDGIHALADILFALDLRVVIVDLNSRRWGTELSRIRIDKISIDQTIWKLDHVFSLSKLRIFTINQVTYSEDFCMKYLGNPASGCKESPPQRNVHASSHACSAKKNALESAAKTLVEQNVKQLPSLQIIYMDVDRFWIERQHGELRKVWRLWDAMDDPIQRAKIDREISLEDWAFLSNQDIDNAIIFLREDLDD